MTDATMNPIKDQKEMGYGESNRKSYYWQEVVYEKSIGTNMKDLDLCLQVV